MTAAMLKGQPHLFILTQEYAFVIRPIHISILRKFRLADLIDTSTKDAYTLTFTFKNKSANIFRKKSPLNL